MKTLTNIASIGLAAAAALVIAVSPVHARADDKKAAGEGVSKDLKGVVKIDGSSTVYPITEAVAEEFNAAAPKVRVTVGVSGTGGGFKRFVAGEIDIADASRPIKKSEFDLASKAKVEFIEIPVAYDGLTIVVNPKNTWCTSLTVAQVKKIYGASGSAKTWKDVDPSWPATPIKVYSPGTDSGTFDYFKETVVGKDGAIRSDMSVSEDDNVLVRGVSGDEGAIGFFGCAYYFENKDKVRAVAIDGGKGAVMPTVQSIEDGSYAPFSRPLFIYVSKASSDRPEVKAFVEFYLKNVARLAGEVGYVKLPDAVYTKVGANWTARRAGSQFIDPKGDHITGSLAEFYK